MESEVVPAWAVVSFPNGGTAAVPTSWLNNKEKLLLWPPKHIHYTKALKDQMQPKPDWTTYENVRLLITCDSYDKAKHYEEKYVRSGCSTTDLESEAEAEERRKRRARPNPLYIESEEESETLPKKRRFAKPPGINFPGAPMFSQSTHTNTDFGFISRDHHQTSLYTGEDYILTELLAPTSSNVDCTPSGNRKTFDLSVNDKGFPTEMNGSAEQVLKDITTNKLIKMTAEVLTEIRQLQQEIKILKAEMTTLTTTLSVQRDDLQPQQKDFPFSLPLNTEEEFDVVDEAMRDNTNRRKMVSRLALIGGTSSQCMIRRMLAMIMTNSLACSFNWKGKGQKRAFKETNLQDCMFVAARQFDRKLLEMTYSDTVKKWLRYAPERKNGIKRKINEKL